MINRFRFAAFGSSLHMLRVWSARAVGGLRSGQVLMMRPVLRQGLPIRTRPRAWAPRWPPPVLTTPSTLRFLARLGSTLAPPAHYRTSPHTPSAFSRARENTRRERCSRGEKMGFARFFTHGSAITAHSARAKAVFSGREFSTSGALPRVSLRDTLNNPDPNHCNTVLCVFESFTNGNLSAMLTENKMP